MVGSMSAVPQPGRGGLGERAEGHCRLGPQTSVTPLYRRIPAFLVDEYPV